MITRPYNFSMTPGEGAAVRGTSSGLNAGWRHESAIPLIYIYEQMNISNWPNRPFPHSRPDMRTGRVCIFHRK